LILIVYILVYKLAVLTTTDMHIFRGSVKGAGNKSPKSNFQTQKFLVDQAPMHYESVCKYRLVFSGAP